MVYGFNFLNKIRSVINIGFKFLYLRLWLIINIFWNSTSVTIIRTNCRSSWAVIFTYFWKKVKLRCLEFAVFEVKRFHFLKCFFLILFFLCVTVGSKSIYYYYYIEEAHGEAVRFFSPRCHIMPKWAHVPWKTVEWSSHLCEIWSHCLSATSHTQFRWLDMVKGWCIAPA